MNTSVQDLLHLARNAAQEPADVREAVEYLAEAIQLLAARCPPPPYKDCDGDLWTRGDEPGFVQCKKLGDYQFRLSNSDVLSDESGQWRVSGVERHWVSDAIAHLWPDYNP